MAKKKKSVLTRQRLKKNRNKNGFFRANLPYFFLLSTSLLILVGTYFYLSGANTRSISEKSRNWKLTLKADDSGLLDAREEQAIIQAVKDSVSHGEKADLLKAVAKIKSDESFAKIHLIRTGLDQLTLYYSKRIPIMCYQAESLYYISAEAEIYGDLENLDNCPGPVVSGILEDRKKQPRGGVLKLSTEEEKAVVLAVKLLKILRFHQHQPSALTYDKYRGFFINLKDLETDIALGNPPYDAKLEKLREVLEKIKVKGEVAQRIELDFQGKAFIKMKKL